MAPVIIGTSYRISIPQSLVNWIQGGNGNYSYDILKSTSFALGPLKIQRGMHSVASTTSKGMIWYTGISYQLFIRSSTIYMQEHNLAIHSTASILAFLRMVLFLAVKMGLTEAEGKFSIKKLREDLSGFT